MRERSALPARSGRVAREQVLDRPAELAGAARCDGDVTREGIFVCERGAEHR